MSHTAVEKARAFFETTECIVRAVKLTRHRHSIGVSAMLKNPHVSSAKHLRQGLEMNPIRRPSDTGGLTAHPFEAVEIHDDAIVLIVDVHVRGSNVRSGGLKEAVMRDPVSGSPAGRAESFSFIPRNLRRLSREMRVLNLKTPWRINSPGALQIVSIRHTNVEPLVISKVEVVRT